MPRIVGFIAEAAAILKFAVASDFLLAWELAAILSTTKVAEEGASASFAMASFPASTSCSGISCLAYAGVGT